ncbi:hypothetical protein AB1E33_12300 [Ruegeria sp. 2012CJ15-1]
MARSGIFAADRAHYVADMQTDYQIEWEGPPSHDHEGLVRETAVRQAQLIGDPNYPRGCNYLRVPLMAKDFDGPGIDCHWDADRHVLICYMDIEDGPLPDELNALPTLYDTSPDLLDEPTVVSANPRGRKRRH